MATSALRTGSTNPSTKDTNSKNKKIFEHKRERQDHEPLSALHGHNQGFSPKEVFQEVASAIYLYLAQQVDEHQDPTNIKKIIVKTRKKATYNEYTRIK